MNLLICCIQLKSASLTSKLVLSSVPWVMLWTVMVVSLVVHAIQKVCFKVTFSFLKLMFLL